jgi:hypothetical protein
MLVELAALVSTCKGGRPNGLDQPMPPSFGMAF